MILSLAAVAAVSAPVEAKYAAPGPFAVAQFASRQACDRKGDLCDVFYPEGQGRRPVIVWGNGADKTPSPPEKYAFLLDHLASWGFVVVATRDGATGSGETLLDAVGFARRQDADPSSPLYGRLDLARLGAAGHSQGASGAANAMLRSGGAITTAVLFHLPQQAFCSAPQTCLATEDLRAAAGGSIFYVGGTADFIISPDKQLGGSKLNSLTAYYGATPERLPKVKAMVAGADHNDIQGRPDCPPKMMGCKAGVRPYLGYPTAWLAWRLTGAPEGQAAFGEDGEIFEAPAWRSVVGNVR